MSLRAGHGNGAGTPRIEVLPADELPEGVHALVHVESTGERRPDGRWVPGASTAQREGGQARRGTTRLARRMGLATLPDDAAFGPYKRAAADFRRAHCSMLSRTVGGGVCGPAASSIVATAAWQLAASRYLFDLAGQTGDHTLFTQASRLGDASRQNLLAAHELAAREASARPRAEHDPLAAFMRPVEDDAPEAAPSTPATPMTPTEDES